jgi:hypothetical protein
MRIRRQSFDSAFGRDRYSFRTFVGILDKVRLLCKLEFFIALFHIQMDKRCAY